MLKTSNDATESANLSKSAYWPSLYQVIGLILQYVQKAYLNLSDKIAIDQVAIPMCVTFFPPLALDLSQLLYLLSPLQAFPNFTFYILPSDSVMALWIQSSLIYEKPLNALQFWRRGGERDYFFLSHSSFIRFFIFVGTHPPCLISS